MQSHSATVDVGAPVPVADGKFAPRKLRLGLRNIYILPSGAGLRYLVAFLLILLCGINYSNSLIYGAAFLMGSMMLICMLHTYRNLSGLELEIGRPESIFAGRRAIFPLRVHNPQGRACHALEWDGWRQQMPGKRSDKMPGKAGKPPKVPAESLHNVLYVPPGAASLFVELSVSAESRGWLSLRRIRISSCYPMGLFRAWANLPSPPRCLVYPRVQTQLPLPPPPMLQEGESTGKELGVEDFQGLRRYQPGDPPRSISWKSISARELLVSQFVGGTSLKLQISWEHVSALPGTEAALSQLCAWILEASESSLEYSLALPGRNIPFGRGEQHCRQCLQALALFELDG